MSKNVKALLWVVVVIIVLVLIVVLTNQKPVETGPIKIGFIGPLTGDAATYGADEKNATMLAVDEINSAGGIKGRNLEVVYEDGKCSGKDSATAAQKLISIDKVKIILGGACSGETLAAAPIAEQNKVILFSAFSSSPDITNSGDYVFRSSPSDLDVVKGYTDFIVKNYGYKNIAILTENTDYAISAREVFVQGVASNGGKIVGDEIFKQGEKDFRTIVAKIKASNADAIFLNPQGGVTGGTALKQLRTFGITAPILGVYNFGGKDAITAAGSAIEGLIFFDFPGFSTEKGKVFASKFTAKYGKPGGSDFDAGAKYDSVYIAANALKKCSEDTGCIKNYLYNMDWYDGTVGRYKFDSNGDEVGIVPLTPMIFKNGQAQPYVK
jgi:branched-chain amino acid transport system substrate-binding protein